MEFTPCNPPVRQGNFPAWLQVVIDGAVLCHDMRKAVEKSQKESLNDLRKRMQKP